VLVSRSCTHNASPVARFQTDPPAAEQLSADHAFVREPAHAACWASRASRGGSRRHQHRATDPDLGVADRAVLGRHLHELVTVEHRADEVVARLSWTATLPPAYDNPRPVRLGALSRSPGHR